MFINNKYHKWYFNIIKNRSTLFYDGYTEKHHIIPRSLGGSNDKNNLIKLSAREHFICHLLLVKFTTGTNRSKMIYALTLMRRIKTHYKITSKSYQIIRRLNAELRTNVPCSEETKNKISIKLTGRKLTPDHILNISKAQTGLTRSLETIAKLSGPKTDEHKKKISAAKIGKKLSEAHKQSMRGIIKSEEHKRKISIAKKGVPLSEEHKRNISLGNIGKITSIEAGQNISKAKKGMIFSEDHKSNLRIARQKYLLNRPKQFNLIVICPHCNKSGGSKGMARWHFNNCKVRDRNHVSSTWSEGWLWFHTK